jgi:hypothetical protein
MSTTPNVNPVPESTLASSPTTRSLILVLCGYLVGITASHVCSPGMEACALAAAAIGMIAQILLVSESRKRQAEQAKLTMQRASIRLERRVELHVRMPAARLLRNMHAARPRMHEQYLSVVHSQRKASSRRAYSVGS